MPDGQINNDAMIRLLHLSWGLEVGGKERVIDQLVRNLAADQFTGTVWTLRRKGKFYSRLEEDGYPVGFFQKWPGFDPKTVCRLRKEITKFKPDLIHVHDSTSTVAVLSALFLKTTPPVIATEHLSYCYLNPLKKMVYEAVLRKTAAVTAVSRQLVEALGGKLGRSVPVLYIPNGIDLKRFPRSIDKTKKRKSLGLSSPGPVIVMVGRLEFNKDHDLLLRAARLVCSRLPNCHFLIVGDGSLRRSLLRLSRQLGLSDKVRFLGERLDVAEILKIADLCVLSSRREGFPLTLLEYMAASRPVVATKVGGVSDIIRDGREGFLVPSGDADNFAARIIQLIQDPSLAREMGRKGNEVVRRDFSLRTMIRSYENVYRSVLERAPPAN